MVDRAGLAATGLVQPGSLYTSAYRLKLAARRRSEGGRPSGSRTRFRSGRASRSRTAPNGAPGTRRFIERLGQFLTLVGLTALIVAGHRRRQRRRLLSRRQARHDRDAEAARRHQPAPSSSPTCSRSAWSRSARSLAGLAVGRAVPLRSSTLVAGDALPVPPRLALYPAPLLLERRLRPAHRLRLRAGAARPRPDRPGRDPVPRRPRAAAPAGLGGRCWPCSAAAGAIAALAVGTAREPVFAAGFIASALGLLLLLTLLGGLIRWIASRLPRPRNPLLPARARQPPPPGARRPAGWWSRSASASPCSPPWR